MATEVQPSNGWDSLSVRQDFFELLRRVERVMDDLPRLGVRADIDQGRIRIRQPADFSFGSKEIADLKLAFDPHTGARTIAIALRNFGPFAPYGPMPIDITEYARDDALIHLTRAFEDFLNLSVSRLAVLNYRAWSQMKQSVGHDRADHNPFLARLSAAVGASDGDTSHSPEYVKTIRRAFAGSYARSTRSLVQLQKILNHYFSTPIRIVPRDAGWIVFNAVLPATPTTATTAEPSQLGKMRLGKRFFDAQYRIAIHIGQVSAPHYLNWQLGSERLRQLEEIVRDFVEQRVICEIWLHISTTSSMAMRLAGSKLGRTAWLHPGVGIHRQLLRSTELQLSETSGVSHAE